MKIAIGKSRHDKNWKNQDWTWEKLTAKLSKPVRTFETVQEYRKMSRDRKATIKDIGGFVGGHTENGRRLKSEITCRSMLTLDADYATPVFWDCFTMLYDCKACLYSTHSHTPEHPRLRLIIPLSRDVTPDEHEAIARKVAENIEMEWFDDTAFRVAQLMYWPSCSKDGEYEFKVQDGELLDADEILAEYDNWQNVEEWPISSREQKLRKSLKAKQEDPLEKKGLVGAFCRTYTIQEAIDKFLPEVYTPSDSENRYTYAEGSSASGLVLYDDKFAYSNHATDPAGGQLCNAFDLVRIHKYGGLDPVDTDKTGTQLPSYKKMSELVTNDAQTKKTLVKERQNDFEGLDAAAFADDQAEESDNWMELLEMTPKGNFAATRRNVVTILNNDPHLKGCIAYDELAQVEITTRDLPWRKLINNKKDRYLRDADDACLRLYLETRYKGTDSKEKAHDAVLSVSTQNAFHPVRDYLNSLEWDGIERVDNLIIDYIGTSNPEDYVRAVTRKTLVAAIARVMNPGCKFDQILTLNGPQGIGKSTLFSKLGGEWFSDTMSTLNGDKTAMESLQGVWIMELGELDAMKKSESSAVKAFTSKTDDFFRSAYAHRKEVHPRQVIFVATTNEAAFLKDETGGRRWWVVDVTGQSEKKAWDLEQPEIDQIWAEAMTYYKHHEVYYKLVPELETIARDLQESHREDAPKLGMIQDFLEMRIPEDWDDFSLTERRTWIQGTGQLDETVKTVRRMKVCAAEIWCELFGKELADIRQMDTREINNLIVQIPGWKRSSVSPRFGEIYGRQRGFVRCGIEV